MKHDEDKIEEFIAGMSESYEVSNSDGEHYEKQAFLPSRDEVRDAIKQYAEHMAQQTLQEIEEKIKGMEYCSKCCSPKEFCRKWGEAPSAVDTEELLSAIKQEEHE